jgi:hypothetical protein
MLLPEVLSSLLEIFRREGRLPIISTGSYFSVFAIII